MRVEVRSVAEVGRGLKHTEGLMLHGRAKAQDVEIPPRQTAHTSAPAPVEPEFMFPVRSDQTPPPDMPELWLLQGQGNHRRTRSLGARPVCALPS